MPVMRIVNSAGVSLPFFMTLTLKQVRCRTSGPVQPGVAVKVGLRYGSLKLQWRAEASLSISLVHSLSSALIRVRRKKCALMSIFSNATIMTIKQDRIKIKYLVTGFLLSVVNGTTNTAAPTEDDTANRLASPVKTDGERRSRLRR